MFSNFSFIPGGKNPILENKKQVLHKIRTILASSFLVGILIRILSDFLLLIQILNESICARKPELGKMSKSTTKKEVLLNDFLKATTFRGSYYKMPLS